MPEHSHSSQLFAGNVRLAWLPVPLFLILIAAFRVAGEGAVLETPFLLLGINVIFYTLISLIIASLMGRSFRVQGKPWQLLLGCGVLIWGALGSISVAAGLSSILADGHFHVNTMITIHNSCVFFSALCHLAGSFDISRQGGGMRRAGLWLFLGYSAALATVLFITFAAMAEWTPRFFNQGGGGTPFRQFVLGASISMFVASAVLLWKQDRRNPSPFSHWYTIALALISVGLVGVSLQSVTGSLLNWTSRMAQSLGSVYMLIAAIASVRETGRWGITVEAALVDAKQQYEELFQLAADGIIVHGVTDEGRWGPFVQANRAMCVMLGYPVEEMRKLTPYDIIVPEERGAVREADELFLTDVVLHEKTLVGKDGRRIVAEISTRPLILSGRRMVMSVVRDVTERKQTENALAESMEKLRLFFEHAPAAVAMFDRDMKYIHCSRRWLADYNIGDRDIIGRSHYEIFPEMPEHWKEIHRRCLDGATEKCEEERFDRRDGSFFWLRWQVLPWRDNAGDIGGIIITTEDVTARKQAEIELKKAHDELAKLVQERTTALDEQSRMLEAYFKHSDSPLVFLDREFNFIRVNEAYARSCGRDVSFFAGRNHFVEYPSHELRENFAKVVRSGEPFHAFARPFIFPEDPEHRVSYWDLFVNPIFDEEGRVDFLVFSLKDVTERKLAEDELREKDSLLLQQSRQAAMGEMINNIAHQWRQPLNTLGLNIQRLPLFYEAGQFSKEFLEESVDDAMMLIQHMSRTIDDFRDFFRPDREKEDFRVSQAIDSAVKLVDATFKSRNIFIVTEYADDPVAYGYANAFSQVMVNLLNNAKDAFEARSTANPRVIIALRTEGERCVVTITDNAGGIPDDILFKIFDPHFTTKGPQGTGIGLFMAKNIIERNMHGRLSVRNCADGAEFRIEV